MQPLSDRILADIEAKNMAKDMGLDEYAVPAVGQGITTMRDDLRPGWQKLRANTWNFHFGTNIMASGGDWLAVSDPSLLPFKPRPGAKPRTTYQR